MTDDDLTWRPRRRAGPQLVIGLLIIVVGLLFILDNLGFGIAQKYLRYWPAGLIVLGLTKLWYARDGRGGAFGGFIITLIGLWLLLEATVDIRISLRDMWPVLLVFFGAYLVWRGITGPRPVRVDGKGSISATAILSGIKRRNSSRAFSGGDVTAIMGSCEIDLRQAAINGDAMLDVLAVWGGIEITVPDDWAVMLDVTALLGAVEDRTRPPLGPAAHRLTIRGAVVMGGVEVRN
jgi:predicted membrane protein